MSIRERTARFGTPVLFTAGFTAALLLAAALHQGFQPTSDVWLACLLLAVLILYGYAGVALERTRQELDMLKRLADRMIEDPATSANRIAPAFPLEAKTSLTVEDRDMLIRLRDAIAADRLELYLQPIVNLPDRSIQFFEAFSRLRDARGDILSPREYLGAAERANRIGVIDNLILLRCVQSLRDIGAGGGGAGGPRVFCNVSPATLYDTEFFAQFSEYLRENIDLAPRLVFELTWPALQLMHPTVEANVRAIGAMGYAFSVDHVPTLALDWQALRDKNIRFVKAEAKVLAAARLAEGAAPERLKTVCARFAEEGVSLIAEKIEREAEIAPTVDLGISYGQGNLFGQPRRAALYLPGAERVAEASAEPLAKAS